MGAFRNQWRFLSLCAEELSLAPQRQTAARLLSATQTRPFQWIITDETQKDEKRGKTSVCIAYCHSLKRPIKWQEKLFIFLFEAIILLQISVAILSVIIAGALALCRYTHCTGKSHGPCPPRLTEGSSEVEYPVLLKVFNLHFTSVEEQVIALRLCLDFRCLSFFLSFKNWKEPFHSNRKMRLPFL